MSIPPKTPIDPPPGCGAWLALIVVLALVSMGISFGVAGLVHLEADTVLAVRAWWRS